MKRFPASSTVTSAGKLSWADVAGPPSPAYPAVPLPATVVMTPSGSILRTRWEPYSTMYRFLPPSTAMQKGEAMAVAGLPSSVCPPLPLPAMVVKTPLVSTLLMQWRAYSAMYRLPSVSTATSDGPLIPGASTPLMTPAVLTLRTTWLNCSAM